MTLTLSLAYLAVLSHQRNRQHQSDILRAQNSVLHSLVHDPASPASPTSSSSTAAPEHHLLEVAKSRWNAEIEAAVRWAQTKDWDEVREDAEGVLARLWRTVSGTPAGEEVKRDAAVVRSRAAEGAEKANAEAARARGTTVSALEAAKERSQAAAANVVAQARETSKHVAEAVHEKAEQGKAAVARGIEKSKEAVEHVKVAAGLAEQKMESRVDNSLLHLSEVDRALAQRYKESRGEVMDKSVEEALAERYMPVEQQDRSKLKAV